MIKVYHANRSIRRDSCAYELGGEFFDENRVIRELAAGNYDAVAEVEGDDLDNAYAETQFNKTFRSTMIGDVMINTETNELFVVAGAGFDPIDPEALVATVKEMWLNK